MPHILITDDDPHLRRLVRTYAELEGFECTEAGDPIWGMRRIPWQGTTPATPGMAVIRRKFRPDLESLSSPFPQSFPYCLLHWLSR